MSKAQSTLEYALIISVVVGALLAMQVYVKRGLQGRLKASTDTIGEQYSPGHTTGVTVVNSTAASTETVAGGLTTTISNTVQSRAENEDIADFIQEDW